MNYVPKSKFFLWAFLTEILSENNVFDIVKKKNDFKGKKNKVLKRPKKWTFSKGVSPWILSKNRTFSYRCFLQKTPFLDISNRKRSFLDQKIEILTRTKKWTFF